MFKKLVAIELNIPDEFKEREDEFMQQLTIQLSKMAYIYKFYFHIKNKEGKLCSFAMTPAQLFTGEYEFVDQIKGF